MRAFLDMPRVLADAEIRLVVRFCRSAEIAKRAGFSGVQVHGAHGDFVSHFVSGHSNQRTDEWGGDAGRRREAVRPIRTGIAAVDNVALLEEGWYARQLCSMGSGSEPKPNESALRALAAGVVETGWGTFQTRRLRV